MNKGNKNTEMGEIISQLNNPEIKNKIEAMRKIVGAMNLGQDVSRLFSNIIPHLETNNMHLKKLIYLYIINYAKSYPELALLAINTFIKDCTNKQNPLLRGLAVRTMGCIRVKHITEHFLEALNETLKDEDAYVRKFAVITVAKIYDTNPELIEEIGFLKILENMLNDKNSMVISNTVASLLHISEKKGSLIFSFNYDLVSSLIISMEDSNDWGKIYVLEAISQYTPLTKKEAQLVIEKILIYLKNRNPGVILTCLKIVIKYLNYFENSDLYEIYLSKINQTLIDLLASESEIQYVVLKNINLLIQKNNNIFNEQLDRFYCNYKDSLSVKIEKLDILVRLANSKNIDKILDEIKEYSSEIDIEFVKKCIRTIGLLAIKLEKSADKCVSVLLDSIKNKPDYVIQEAIIVVKDIFRKYPGRYTKIIQNIFTKIKQIEDPETKSSLIWIIGEYIDIINNPQGLIMGFLETIKEESNHVQLQILTTCVRLYLNNPKIGLKPLQTLFEIIKQTENPDLRERGYFYWRMIGTNPSKAKELICKPKKPISDQSFNINQKLLNKLIDNFNNLSSIYYKLPTVFVKILRDGTNQKYEEAVENLDDFLDDDINLEGINEDIKINNNNYDDFLNNYNPTNIINENNNIINENNNNINENKKNNKWDEIDNILGLNDNIKKENNNNVSELDILNINQNNKDKKDENIENKEFNILNLNQENKDLENLKEKNKNENVNILNLNNNNDNNTNDNKIQKDDEIDLINIDNNVNNDNKDDLDNLFNIDNKEKIESNNIKIPYTELIKEDKKSKSENFQGLNLFGVFQKRGNQIFFDLKFKNNSSKNILVNSMKFNKNSFKLRPINENLNINIQANQNLDFSCEIDLKGESSGIPPNSIISVDIAIILNVNGIQELFIFNSLVSFTVLFDIIKTKDGLDKNYFSNLLKRPNQVSKQCTIKKNIIKDDLIKKFENNNIAFVYSQKMKDLEMLNFYFRIIDRIEIEIAVQIIINNSQLMIKYQIPHPSFAKWVVQSLNFIIDF